MLLVASVFVAVNIITYALQEPISKNDGKGDDGVQYYHMARQFAEGRAVVLAGAPHVYRIGTPLLAALLLKEDLLLSFKILNIAANVVTAVLLVVWLRLHIGNWKIRVLLNVLFLTQWHGPIRFVYYNPAYVDPWAIAILLGGLIGIHKAKGKATWIAAGYLSLLIFVGVLFREVAVVIAIAFLFSTNPVFRDAQSASSNGAAGAPPRFFVVPLLCGLAGLAAVRCVAVQGNSGYSFIATALWFAWRKPLTYVHAWFVTFGPILTLLIYRWRQVLAFLVNHQAQFVYLMAFALLAWIGGTDTERILYWSMPVIYAVLGKALENSRSLLRSPLLLAVLGLGQCVSQRLLWAIPDHPSAFPYRFPILTPPGTNVRYLDLWSFHSESVVGSIAFYQYLLLAIALLIWLRKREQRLKLSRRRRHVP